MTNIILLPSGEWEYEQLMKELPDTYARIVIGEGWLDRDISTMIRDYYADNLDSIFQ